MFYVEHIINILKRTIFLSLAFMITTMFLFNYLAFRTDIESKINHFVASKIAKPHFFGLIDNKVNVQAVRRKLVGLPGIAGVSTVDDTKIKAKVSSIISGLDESLSYDDMKLSYSGLKIIFDPEIRNKGQTLLRNYLVRLVGEDNVILGPVLSSNRQDSTTSKWIRGWGYLFVLVSLSVFWLMLTSQFVYRVFFESKVIEKFKRTNYVAEKSCLILVCSLSLIIVLPQLMIKGTVDLISLGVFALSMFLMTILFNTKKWI